MCTSWFAFSTCGVGLTLPGFESDKSSMSSSSSSFSDVSELVKLISFRFDDDLSMDLILLSLLELKVRNGVDNDFLVRFDGLTVSGVLVFVCEMSKRSPLSSLRFLEDSAGILSILLKLSLKVFKIISSRRSVSSVSIS